MFFRSREFTIFGSLEPVKPRIRECAKFGNLDSMKKWSHEHAEARNLELSMARTDSGICRGLSSGVRRVDMREPAEKRRSIRETAEDPVREFHAKTFTNQ
jgi:hypothetical protein